MEGVVREKRWGRCDVVTQRHQRLEKPVVVYQCHLERSVDSQLFSPSSNPSSAPNRHYSPYSQAGSRPRQISTTPPTFLASQAQQPCAAIPPKLVGTVDTGTTSTVSAICQTAVDLVSDDARWHGGVW